MSLTKKILFVLMVCFVVAGVSKAETDDPNQGFKIVGQGRLPDGKILSPLEKKMSKIVSANYVDAPIESVLNQLARQANVDVIISPDVSGNVTVSLTDVPLYEALTNILAAHNFGFIPTENMIRVVPLDQISVESQKMVDSVFRIKYADVEDVAKALEKFISEDGVIAYSSGTGNIMVMDTEQKVAAIEKFIYEIDRETPQVIIEARIYDIKSQDNLDLGVDWIAGTRTTYDATTGVPSDGRRQPFAAGGFRSNSNKADVGTDFLRVGLLNNSVNLDFRLRAEQDDISATLLANPRVLVLDNERAEFKSIEEIPYQELQETSSGGSIGTIDFKEVGVKLVVTPHIIEKDNKIRLRVQPEFSIRSGNVTIAAGSSNTPLQQPIIDRRSADTTLIIKSGETVVLGGLRKKDISIEKNKVPLLGDIPGIGALFSSNSESTVNSELVIFVTPRIVKRSIMSKDEIDQYKKTNLTPMKDFDKGVIDRKREADFGPDPVNK